jgi:hypothetical protein
MPHRWLDPSSIERTSDFLLDDDATAAEASATVKTLLPDMLDSLAGHADDFEVDTEVTDS